MKRSWPHAEDPDATAGGDTSALLKPMGRRVTISDAGTPNGEDKLARPEGGIGIENAADQDASHPDGVEDERPVTTDFLRLVSEAESQSARYIAQVNRRAWSQSYRAFHNEHFVGSKYTRPDWRGRSKLFVPKTRTAVRKDLAAVAASLFNNIDAVTCLPGNEADPKQKAAAAVMEELVNYRTDRASQKNSIPWFACAMGARQDSLLTGICLSKQSWKQVHRKTGEEKTLVPNEDGVHEERTRDTYSLEVDRPDIQVIPPENFIIDASADWTNPVQSAAFVILKWPMQIEEVYAKQDAPVNPWNKVSDAVLRGAVETGQFDSEAIRRARESGLDRLNETQTGMTFQIVWVYEVFMRVDGEDWTFYSIGNTAYLTDPKPVREVYPEQYGERPLAMGYGMLEAHRIFPMSPVESWQMLQLETNDLRNLMLDAIKQNVMPITKVVRGRQIDLDQVKRRSSGSSIIVTNKDDVTWENPPQMPQSAAVMSRELDLELDDLAGQQNYGSVETNNALGKTLGGLKLAAGAANAVQEYDIRVWIESWVTPALTQVVRLEQYYESDPIVLAIAGQKAQLFEKYGISHIDDELLEADVTVRVSVGLGAGDPAQRLAKFQQAATIVAPLLAQTKEFQSGQVEINWEEVTSEVFGATGYKDGGQRFFRKNPGPAQNPMADLQQKRLMAQIAKDERTGKAAMMSGIAAVAKIALGKRELEADIVDNLLGHQAAAKQLGFDHGHRHNEQHLSAIDHGHRHGLEIAKHRHQVATDALNAAQQAADAQDGGGDGQDDTASAASPAAAGPSSASPGPPSAPPPPSNNNELLMQLLREGKLKFTRDQHGRIAGIELPQRGGPSGGPYPTPNAA